MPDAYAQTSMQDPPAHTRRVLLIDDEGAIVRIFERALEGSEVVTAIGGSAALEVLAVDSAFDVILCDLMMPNVDGPMIWAYLHEHLPHLEERLVFCSGGAFSVRVREFLDEVPAVVLDKPVSIPRLRETVRAVIARAVPR